MFVIPVQIIWLIKKKDYLINWVEYYLSINFIYSFSTHGSYLFFSNHLPNSALLEGLNE